MEQIKEIQVCDLEKPLRIDKYLAHRFTYLSRNGWQRQIESGKIFINSVQIKSADKRIDNGDIVEFKGKKRAEPAIDKTLKIIYEDPYMIAVNKSGDMPVHPAGAYFHNTLTSLLENRFNCKFYLIHRLDRETSGVIIAARKKQYAATFQNVFKNAQKEYNAIVYGQFPEKIVIDMPLGQDVNSMIRKKRAAFPGAKEIACTHFFGLDSFNGFSLVKAVPKTGRLHQIRAHLSYAGFPVVGDKLYGKSENFFLKFIKNGMTDKLLKELLLSRCALHALRLKFFHPFFGKEIELKAELPEDMQKFLKEQKSG